MPVQYRNAQDIANYFQLYLARDSNLAWHAFEKKPTLSVRVLKDDDGNDVECGVWRRDDGKPYTIHFVRGVRGTDDWKNSLVEPQKPQKKDNKEGFNKNKGQGNQKFEKKENGITNIKPKQSGFVVPEKKPLSEETQARLKELFK